MQRPEVAACLGCLKDSLGLEVWLELVEQGREAGVGVGSLRRIMKVQQVTGGH